MCISWKTFVPKCVLVNLYSVPTSQGLLVCYGEVKDMLLSFHFFNLNVHVTDIETFIILILENLPFSFFLSIMSNAAFSLFLKKCQHIIHKCCLSPVFLMLQFKSFLTSLYISHFFVIVPLSLPLTWNPILMTTP